MHYLKQSTASQSVLLGPFIDDTDGKTAETGLTVNASDIRLSKNGGNMAAKNSGGGTHDEAGWYAITLDATDTNTVGRLQISAHVTGALPVWLECTVLEESIYDALFGSSATGFDSNGRVDVGEWLGTAVTLSATTAKPQVDIDSIDDDATAADNLETACDNYSATRGLAGTALPAAAADAAGGLPISDAGGLDLDTLLNDVIRDNTAQAGASTSITLDASASAVDDWYNCMSIEIYGGTGSGQTRYIGDYNGTTKVATIHPIWLVNPDATSTFRIRREAAVHMGLAIEDSIVSTSFAANSIDSTAIANDAITNSVLATTAVNEIRDAILADSTAFNGASIAAILTDTGTTLDNHLTDIKGTGFAKDTHSLTDIQADVTGLNGDAMRGTDNAFLAASAPTNFSDLAITVTTGKVTVGTNDDKTGYSISGSKTTLDALNDLSTADVDARLAAIGLDHLVSTSVTGTDVADNSIFARLVSSGATADWDNYANTTDSLQAIRDHIGDGSNLTEAGGTGDHLTAVTWNAAWDAEVQSEVNDALVAIHLDHLLAVDYDPASKPGVATALLNELVESDGGVSRFTANALEQAPTGSLTAAAIADAVWDEAQADHVGAGTFGELATEIASILADSNELQTDWADGGRLDVILDARAAEATVAALNDLSTADIDARLAAIGLDHLLSASVAGTDVADNSIFAKLVSASATADWDDFVNTTDSLQAIRDHIGDGSNLSAITLAADQSSVTIGTLNTLADGAIGAAAVADIFSTTTIAESYAADGAAATPAQLLYLIQQSVHEFAISGTTRTVKKLDGSTTAATFTLDSDTTPTSTTRAS